MFAKMLLLSIRRLYLRFRKFISVSLCLLLFCNTAVFPAIVAGTIIKTSQGLVPIEALVVGSRVLSLKKDSFEKGSLVETEIVSIKEEEKKPIIGVKIEKETLFVEQDHLFYDSSINDWVKAKKLTDKSLLVDFEKNNHKCFGLESSCEDAKTYEVSLEKPNTFFIHKSQILVHNIGPAIVFVGAVGTGGAAGGVAGAAGWTGIGAIVIGAFTWFKCGGKWVRVKDGARKALDVCKFIASPFVRFVKKASINSLAKLELKVATIGVLAVKCLNNNSKVNVGKINVGIAN